MGCAHAYLARAVDTAIISTARALNWNAFELERDAELCAQHPSILEQYDPLRQTAIKRRLETFNKREGAGASSG